MSFSEPLPESGTTNTASLAPTTPDARNEFAPIPVWGNAVSSDELVAPDTKRLPRKIRARDEKMCPMDKLQLNNGEDNGRQPPPTGPNAQQVGSRQNSGWRPKPKPRLFFPPQDDNMSYMFIEDYERPKPHSEICPEPMHPVPVCCRPIDAYNFIYPNPAVLTIEPCHFYLAPFGSLDDTFGYCCLTAEVAYASDDLTQRDLDLWTNFMIPSRNIRQRIRAGLREPFKLVGLGCRPMQTTGEQGRGQRRRPL